MRQAEGLWHQRHNQGRTPCRFCATPLHSTVSCSHASCGRLWHPCFRPSQVQALLSNRSVLRQADRNGFCVSGRSMAPRRTGITRWTVRHAFQRACCQTPPALATTPLPSCGERRYWGGKMSIPSHHARRIFLQEALRQISSEEGCFAFMQATAFSLTTPFSWSALIFRIAPYEQISHDFRLFSFKSFFLRRTEPDRFGTRRLDPCHCSPTESDRCIHENHGRSAHAAHWRHFARCRCGRDPRNAASGQRHENETGHRHRSTCRAGCRIEARRLPRHAHGPAAASEGWRLCPTPACA